jgi:hypothetical protein
MSGRLDWMKRELRAFAGPGRTRLIGLASMAAGPELRATMAQTGFASAETRE